MHISSRFKEVDKLHYWATGLLTVGLVPCLRRMNLPTKFDWIGIGAGYWIVLSAESIFVAVILCLVGFGKKALGPTFARFKNQKSLILIVLAFFFALHWVLTWGMAIVLTVDAVAIVEFFNREVPRKRGGSLLGVMLPAFYLFVCWLLIFA